MTQSVEIKYSFKGVPTLRKFSDDTAYIRAVLGPFGSGKSSACVVEMVQQALKQRPGPDGIKRYKWLVVRNTFPQLRDTTIRTVHQWLPPHHFGEYKQSDQRYIVKAFEGVELEFIYRALDRQEHVSNLLSLEVSSCWLNEFRECPYSIFEAVQGRVGRYPAVRDGGCAWHGVIMDSNPFDTDAKYYKWFMETEHPPSFCKLFRQPSGLSPEAENLDNLPGGRLYYERLASGKDPEWTKVYVHGEFGYVNDGRAIFPEYRDATHCAEVKPMAYEPIYRGWDWGLTPSCVFCQMTPLGQLVILDELTSDDMSVENFSEEVIIYCNKHFPDYEFMDVGDPAGEQRSQTDAKSCFQILHSKGIMVEAGAKTLALRLESVRRPLTRLVSGRPGLQISPKCKMLRKGFMGGYQFRRLQTSQERYTDAPDKNQYSHPHDALQYVCSMIFGGALTTQRMTGGREVQDELDSFSNASGRSDVTGY